MRIEFYHVWPITLLVYELNRLKIYLHAVRLVFADI